MHVYASIRVLYRMLFRRDKLNFNVKWTHSVDYVDKIQFTWCCWLSFELNVGNLMKRNQIRVLNTNKTPIIKKIGQLHIIDFMNTSILVGFPFDFLFFLLTKNPFTYFHFILSRLSRVKTYHSHFPFTRIIIRVAILNESIKAFDSDISIPWYTFLKDYFTVKH